MQPESKVLAVHDVTTYVVTAALARDIECDAIAVAAKVQLWKLMHHLCTFAEAAIVYAG